MARRHKVAILTAAAVVLFALVLVLEDRLGPIDPTSPGRRAVVFNDTNRPVHVKSDDYNPLLPPGRSDIFYPGGLGELSLRLVIADEQGQTIGCIPVKLQERTDVRVYTSSVGPCQ